MGVVFFPSLPFMGVMLFPSFVLRKVSGEGGTLLVPLSLFSVLLSLHLLLFSFSFFSILYSSLSSFFPYFLIPFSFPYAQNLSITFFFFSYFPPLSFCSPFSISFSFPLAVLRFFFLFRELLILCTSKM